MKLGISKSTGYRVMKKMDKGELLTMKSGSGRKANKMTPSKVLALKRYLMEHLGASQRKAALKFGVSLAYVNKIVRARGVSSLSPYCVSFFSEFSFEPVTLRDLLFGQSRRHVSWAVGLWV